MTWIRTYKLMLVLLLLLGCSNGRKEVEHSEETGRKTGFLLCPPPLTIYGEPVHIRFDSRSSQDSLSVERKLADRVRRNMMHWYEYSTMESDR